MTRGCSTDWPLSDRSIWLDILLAVVLPSRQGRSRRPIKSTATELTIQSQGYSPTDSGLAILPVTLVSGLSTAIVGVLISKSGRYRLAVLLGWAILALGSGLLELLGRDTLIPQWIFITAVSGLGGGILFTALAIASQSHVAREHIAIAAALTPFVRAIVSKFSTHQRTPSDFIYTGPSHRYHSR